MAPHCGAGGGAVQQQLQNYEEDTQEDIVSQVQPNRTALDSFADLETEELLECQGVEKLWMENQNGTVMALAKGAQPAADIAIQVRVLN